MSKRLANFGGVGGQYSPFSPGGSPLFRGGPSGYAGYGINNFSGDVSLDDLMGRYRKPDVLGDYERPLETLLETFHDNLETDIPSYLLSPEERNELSVKKKIRNKEQYIKNLSKPKYKDNSNVLKKLHTVEDLLEDFRKNTKVDFSKFAAYTYPDEAPLEIRLKNEFNSPDSFRRERTSLPTNDNQLISYEEYKNDPMANAQYTEAFTGIAPQYELGKGVDKYIDNLNNPTFPENHNMQNSTLLINTPNESQTFHNHEGSYYDLPSPVTQESKKNNLTLEQKLQKLKKSPKNLDRLDPDFLKGIHWDEYLKGIDGKDNQTPWGNDGMGGNVTNEYPDTSNNPYFSLGVLR